MEEIFEILKTSKTIAVIGFKNGESDDAYKIPNYMYQQGYKIFPVNPKYKDKKILGGTCVSSVTTITQPIDIVNIFRKPEFVLEHAKEILSMKVLPKCVWMQLGIYNFDAEKLLSAKGIKVVQGRCIMVEHLKLKSDSDTD